MNSRVILSLAVEDDLSEVVLRTILKQTKPDFAVGACYKRGGFGYLRSRIRAFNAAARVVPFLVLTDLDQTECAPALIAEWLQFPTHPNLVLRVAVRAVEAWVMADRQAFASFLGISEPLVPPDMDLVARPKSVLIDLAGKSRRRDVKEDIVPRHGSTARQGPNYNGRLAFFMLQHWRACKAANCSQSLWRTIAALKRFPTA